MAFISLCNALYWALPVYDYIMHHCKLNSYMKNCLLSQNMENLPLNKGVKELIVYKIDPSMFKPECVAYYRKCEKSF